MRHVAMTRLLLVVAGCLIAGCAQTSALTPAQEEQQLMLLIARADELRVKLLAETGAGEQLRPEFNRLVADARTWLALTGRSDIRIVTEQGREPATAAAAPGGVGDNPCKPCPGYQVWPDHVCFLIEEGPCDPDEDGLILRVCAYECIFIGTGLQSGASKIGAGRTKTP